MSNTTTKKVKPTPIKNKMRFVLRDEVAGYGDKQMMDSPEKIYEFFRDVVATEENFESQKEHVVVAVLNSRLRLVGYNVVSIGSVNEATAHPREILRPVIISAGHSFVLMHNHPGGDSSPSRADEQVTRRIVEAAEIFQIRFLDHVVVGVRGEGRSPYYSFREAGVIP
jgi:DNA repair protein RadC